MDLKLSETVKAIRRAKRWTQRAMAAEIQVDFQDIQRAENAGRNLEKQFALFLKLLPLIEARELKDPPELEGVNDAVAAEIEKFEQKEKMSVKKTPVSSLQKSRAKGHSRR